MSENVGTLARMLIDTSSITSSSKSLVFLSEDIKATHELIEDDGTRGTRSRSKERVGRGLTKVGGQTRHKPSPTELDFLLPALLGADESADVFALTDALTARNIAVLRGSSLTSAGMFTYDGMIASQWEFSGEAGQAIQLTIDWIGKGVTRASGASFPSVAIDTDGVYLFAGGVLTVRGSSRRFKKFSLRCNNFADPEFNNSLTATDVDALDRDLELSFDTPYIASHGEALLTTEAADTNADGAAASLVFNSNRGSGQSLTFTLANIKPILEDPTVGGRQKIRLPMVYKCYKSSTTNELVVTHDSTP